MRGVRGVAFPAALSCTECERLEFAGVRTAWSWCSTRGKNKEKKNKKQEQGPGRIQARPGSGVGTSGRDQTLAISPGIFAQVRWQRSRPRRRRGDAEEDGHAASRASTGGAASAVQGWCRTGSLSVQGRAYCGVRGVWKNGEGFRACIADRPVCLELPSSLPRAFVLLCSAVRVAPVHDRDQRGGWRNVRRDRDGPRRRGGRCQAFPAREGGGEGERRPPAGLQSWWKSVSVAAAIARAGLVADSHEDGTYRVAGVGRSGGWRIRWKRNSWRFSGCDPRGPRGRGDRRRRRNDPWLSRVEMECAL